MSTDVNSVERVTDSRYALNTREYVINVRQGESGRELVGARQ